MVHLINVKVSINFHFSPACDYEMVKISEISDTYISKEESFELVCKISNQDGCGNHWRKCIWEREENNAKCTIDRIPSDTNTIPSCTPELNERVEREDAVQEDNGWGCRIKIKKASLKDSGSWKCSLDFCMDDNCDKGVLPKETTAKVNVRTIVPYI